MSEFASEETMATDEEIEAPVEPESSVDDATSATASNDEDWED
jgi:hypothetical protein